MLALIPALPLLGFLINGIWYAFGQAAPAQQKSKALVPGVLASVLVSGSFFISLWFFIQLFGLPESEKAIEQTLWSWMQIGNFRVDLTFRLDSLSSIFALVITGVGALIHFYSIGYMGDDETAGKYFAFLNLFCFAMLVLVLGDLGFLLGMFLVFTTFGTLNFHELSQMVARGSIPLDGAVITVICILLFIGCMGKSAQIPLYVWLPDAMAGPTPVSALIHAATMVTSGIYLVSRLNFLYSLSPEALGFVAWVGAITAFFAATIAIVQTDIKKVLAYSTVSQLGYMFLGCGVGAYSSGVFHVVTHAFFKALLFLGAGNVIYGMHHEQDILKMGGLKTRMPKTFFVFAMAWLAICGIPPFSGFFSKDEILWSAFASSHGSTALWAMGAVTAVMTAFYMTRLFSLTFLGEPRFDPHHHKVHESPNIMIYPLIILAALSVLGGLMGIPHASWLEHWLEPVIAGELQVVVPHSMEWVLMLVSTIGALFGILLGLRVYGNLPKIADFKNRWATAHKILFNKWYVDEIYHLVFVRTIGAFSGWLWRGFDDAVIDRLVIGTGRASRWTGQTVRIIQTGSIQIYAFMMVVGLFITLGFAPALVCGRIVHTGKNRFWTGVSSGVVFPGLAGCLCSFSDCL